MNRVTALIQVSQRFSPEVLLEEEFSCEIPPTQDRYARFARAKMQYRQRLTARLQDPQDPAYPLRDKELTIGGYLKE